MEHMFFRVWESLIARVTGPMKFRLVMQPAMAIFFASSRGAERRRQGDSRPISGVLSPITENARRC